MRRLVTLVESYTTPNGHHGSMTFLEPTMASARKWLSLFKRTFPHNPRHASVTYTIFDRNGNQREQVTLSK